MFVLFIVFTMGITKWASKRNTSTSDYYTAGGSITGFQNGLAIAGDYMSAASFLGISALVYTSGYDGLIYSIGVLVGWPLILFLMAERLRNLGKFSFSDVASYRLGQTQIRILSAMGSLTVVAFYLIAQMVGAGKLIQLLFGLDDYVAVVLVGALMMIYVLFGGMLATTWVQIIKAVLLLSGASFMALMVMKNVGFDLASLFSDAVKLHEKGDAIMSPGGLVTDPISAISQGMALMFGTAGLPHILMRFFTVSDAKEARKSVFEKQNIAFMVGLAFSIAASCNFPVLFLSMYWKGLSTRGALIGGSMGLLTALILTILSPTVWVQVLGNAEAIFPYSYPALFSIIAALVGIWFFSVTDKSITADAEGARFFPQFVRSQTDLGATGAVAH